jgi:hypothetical protein
VAAHGLSDSSAGDGTHSFQGTVRATLWPTLSLTGSSRWFDELYVWTEGSSASPTQRAHIQINALRDAFRWLEYDLVDRVGVTISFGTVERALDPLTALFERNVLLAHRTFVIVRGTPKRLRARYRLRAFAEMLRGLDFAVGYRISAPQVSAELVGIDLVQPSFAKVLATSSPQEESWNDLALEVRALGLDIRSTVIGGLEAPEQARMASRAGFELGQGRAIRQPYPPPSVPGGS